MPKQKEDPKAGGPPLWVVHVPVASVSTEETTPELRVVSLDLTGSDQPQAVTIRVGVKDTEGNWRVGVMVEVLRLIDDPTNSDPVMAEGGTHMADLLLTSRIGSGNPLADKYGVAAGTPLGEALTKIAWSILNPQPPAQAPEDLT